MTLVETLLAIAFFAFASVGIYRIYVQIWDMTNAIRARDIATNLANEQFEVARTLQYEDLGTVGGIPPGVLDADKIETREGVDYRVRTYIRAIDDPFDGLFPADSSPGDNRLMEVRITCERCEDLTEVLYTTRIAPKQLESESTNGNMRIEVFDGSGDPLPNADIHIVNTSITPAVDLNDTTNVNGELLIIDAPPSFQGYEITATKDGYSTDRTYSIDDPLGNTTPSKPHATVAQQQLTQISLQIDEFSSFQVQSETALCVPVSNVDFDLTGAKRIGENPVILKYVESHETNGSGYLDLEDIEWDTYTLRLMEAGLDLIGTNPILPIALEPGVNQSFNFTVAPASASALHVIVYDLGSSLPISNASVRLEGPSSFDETLITGRGFITQSEWQGGSGQDTFIDSATYWAHDGNIEDGTPSPGGGDLILDNTFGTYQSSGWLESSTFNTGSISNFHEIFMDPETQSTETGEDSVRFQVATNIDGVTWNYIGPDGTSGSYYTRTNRALHASQSANQYLRYKVFLSTDDTSISPTVSDIFFTFTSECIPPGQVMFSDFISGTFDLEITHANYDSVSQPVTVSGSEWQSVRIGVTPSL